MSLRCVRVVLVLAVVAILFASSFKGPAILFRQVSVGPHSVEYPQGQVTKTGKQMVLASLFGFIRGNFAGLANPLLLLGCVHLVLRKHREAVRYLGLAVVMALQTFGMMLIAYPEDEGGVMMSYMMHPLAGWYRWFGAILLAFLLAVEQRWSETRDLERTD